MKLRDKKVIVISFTNYDNDSRIQKKVKFFEKQKNLKVCLLVKCSQAYGKSSPSIKRLNSYEEKLGPLGSIPFLKGFLFYFNVGYYLITMLRSISLIDVNDLKPLPSAVLSKLLTLGRIRLIYDCHEYETEIQFFNKKPIRKYFSKLKEKICLMFVDEVICVTKSIAEKYSEDYGIMEPHLVMNCAPYVKKIENKNLFRQKFNIPQDKKIFLYQGALSTGRGLSETIEAFKMIGTNDVLVVMGQGTLKPLVESAALENDNIFYHESVSPNVLLSFTASADFGICFAPNICKSYYYSLSNKIFEYIQARIPLLVSPLYEFKKIVEKESIGVVAADDSVAAIVASIHKMSSLDSQLFKNNCERIAFDYSWESQQSKLENIYMPYFS